MSDKSGEILIVLRPTICCCVRALSVAVVNGQSGVA